MEGDREPRRRRGKPAEPPVFVFRFAAQRSVFELQVHGIEPLDLAGNLLNTRIGKPPNAAMCAAHQVLVEIEDGNVERVLQLPFQCRCVRGDAAQLALRRHDREPLFP